MTLADQAAALKTCPRCGRVAEARGQLPLRYCPVCGQRLTPLQEEVQHALSGRRAASGLAIAALVCGVLALVPIPVSMAGLGGAAIVFGLGARARIVKSQGRLRGGGLALLGITLGAVGLLYALAALVVGRH